MIQKAGQKSKDKKELLRRMLEQDKLEKVVVERGKSANQRELELHFTEENEKQIKEQLDVMRKRRQDEINFGSNPLDVENIITKTKWHVLKEKNQFAKRGNMFQGQGNIHKSNPNLLKSGNVLHGENMFKHKGGGLI